MVILTFFLFQEKVRKKKEKPTSVAILNAEIVEKGISRIVPKTKIQ